MEIDKTAVIDSWQDLQTLQKETELLLQTIRQKPVSKGKGKQVEKDNNKTPKRTPASKSKLAINADASTAKKKLKQQRKDLSLQLNGSGTNELNRTQDLYSQSRVTVEVLDDASPDNTPRLEVDIRAEKERASIIKRNLQKLKSVEASEQGFRSVHFNAEKTRLLSENDTFVPAPGVTHNEVDLEKQRLQRIEESARIKLNNQLQVAQDRAEFFGKDKSALKVQSLFRGHIGRQKFALSKRLHDLLNEDVGDWIEVRDRESGDTWFYNKVTGESQWERPDDMFSSLASKSSLKALPTLQGGSSAVSPTRLRSQSGVFGSSSTVGLGKRLLSKSLSMTLPSLEATMVGKHSLSKSATFGSDTMDLGEAEAKREIGKIMGVDAINAKESLIGPDGYFKPQLRATVMDTLLGTRFDSVSTVLADDRWMDAEKDPFLKQTAIAATEGKVDPLRKSMAAVVKLNDGKPKKIHRFEASNSGLSQGHGQSLSKQVLEDYTLKAIPHPGFNDEMKQTGENGNEADHGGSLQTQPATMCFGCWSSGARRGCAMHDDGSRMKPSETMLLCRNWDLSVMKRRYRSEEIQEIFLRKAPSLRYNAKRKAFSTVEEQRHIIYRYYRKTLDGYNERFNIMMKAKRWLVSLADAFRVGKVKRSKAAQEKAGMMRLRRTLQNDYHVKRFTKTILDLLSIGPTTGYSWPERIGAIQYLYTVTNPATGQEVEIILAYPIPVSKFLMLPREYHLSLPRNIPMPKPDYRKDDLVNVMPKNTFIDDYHPGAWFEKLVSGVVKECRNNAMEQIKAVTPLPGLEKLKRTKHPIPWSIKFATIARKPTPGLIDVGGLPIELLIYQLVTTYVPSQYSSLMVMDKSVVSPGISPEVMITFASLPMPPVKLDFVLRPLEHPLNYRRVPTIGIHSKTQPMEKHFYGPNRPEQTGEQESHGFRTTTWSKEMLVYEETDPQTFMPGTEIASLNNPNVNLSKTTHADLLYPFCEPSTRDNSTLDFYHLLLYSVVSAAKAQVFTALTVQEAGKFMKGSRDDLPMGHLVASIYRSWAFTQKDLIEEYKTDEGIPYWYHRRTGQTFWERPLYEDEEASPLHGGTILDMQHDEEPLTSHTGAEGTVRRYHQGEVRNHLLAHHESDAEAVRRRQAAANAARLGRQRGAFPELVLKPSSNSDENDHPTENSLSSLPGAGTGVAIGSLIVSEGGVGATSNQNRAAIAQNKLSDDVVSLRSSTTETFSIPGEVARQKEKEQLMAAIPGGSMMSLPGLDANMMMNMTDAISKMMTGMMDNARPEDMIQMGLGMGMAMMQGNAMPNLINSMVEGPSGKKKQKGGSIFGDGDDMSELGSLGEQSKTGSLAEAYPPQQSFPGTNEPIGVPNRTMHFSANKQLEHGESDQQRADIAELATTELTSVERARKITIEVKEPTETPDVAPKKVLTHELPANADVGNRMKVPILVYPELSTAVDGGPMKEYIMHPSAGIDTSFVLEKRRESQKMVAGSDDTLRRTVMPLPVGFFDAIATSHVAGQYVDYLPQVPNLPQARTVGRVRPRSTALDWLSIAFDPWSAGKTPLNSEYVNSLSTKAEKFFDGGAVKAAETMETLRQATVADAFANVDDNEGQIQQRAEITKAQVLAQDFKKACSLARHNKYSEIEQLLNQPDWNVPIDYQDEQGNTLLHTAAQNGNKRLAKLCLRRGAALDVQNLRGQTALHYAFGYGYADVGEYLVKRGCNDSLRNKDGLTCYEGLGARELAQL